MIHHSMAIFAAAACILASGCTRTVNDYVVAMRSGTPEDVEEGVYQISRQLASQEAAGIEFDEGDRVAIALLRQLALQSASRNDRALAVEGLGRLATIDAADVFLAAMDDSFWLCRMNAVRALQGRSRESFSEPLRKRLELEKRVEVRIAIVRALARIGGDESLRALYGIYLSERLAGQESEQSERAQAYLGLRQLTGLTHGFRERSKWELAFTKFFPGSEGSSGSDDRRPDQKAAEDPTTSDS